MCDYTPFVESFPFNMNNFVKWKHIFTGHNIKKKLLECWQARIYFHH